MNARTTVSPELLARIAAAAPGRDRQGTDLGAEVGWLSAAGALVAALPATLRGAQGWADDPRLVADVMAEIGRASLPLGRLYEGHVNAAQLIALYGSARLKEECVAQVRAGALLGVWGADGEMPVEARRSEQGLTLSGGKAFCSGLGLVQLGLVSACCEGRTLLVALDVTNSARADHAQWRVSGMRATTSGGYDLSGIVVTSDFVLGEPDDYYAEPYFLGGMYRMCAVQLGGLDALISAFVQHAQRRTKHPAILGLRVGGLLTQALLVRAVTYQLAGLIADRNNPTAVARQAILTREGVERCIVECLAIVGRAGGTSVHREGTALSRIARDLSLYIRQGAIDERLIDVGSAAVAAANTDDRKLEITPAANKQRQ